MRVGNHKIPSRGDRIEQRQNGIRRIGYVWYSDQLQVLVKWQDGKSSSLRIGRDQFSIQTAAVQEAARSRDQTLESRLLAQSRRQEASRAA
jgi:hypothetical protein